ncbi:hypothetical protein LWC34_02075 [Kibdelosporangium philippinense]|uniref:Proteins of 100 residues with WXG n=1 Tax=Kibdelosporangium philippinense TaxID=211113 RepID=A0ABS8Z3Q5_9PSEU|nr:hypothetical protein [Kibdelosporangium philippinense]MCE7001633.1 hypothetical protein [Kibdelosporangium philippinense]
MGFSEAQFNETINKLNQGMSDLSKKIGEVPQAANAAVDHWYIPGFIKDAIMWCAEKICELANWIWNKIQEVMRGIAAPVYFFKYAFDWQDIRGITNGVTGQLKPEAMPAANSWTGSAATAYKGVIKPQGDAANKIATVSDKTSTALQICAGVGLTFYVAIGIILLKFIAAMVVAIAAFGSAVFSWTGAAIVVEEAAVNSGLIWGAIGALTAALGTQAQQMISLHGEAIDNSTFPGGHWPDATTGSYNDASVKDGDADWSLNK